MIGGVQELGSVLGPLYGGLILTVASWQTIFWLNLPIAGVLAIGLLAAGRADRTVPAAAHAPRARIDRVSIGLAAWRLVAGCLSIWSPGRAPRQRQLSALAFSALGGMPG